MSEEERAEAAARGWVREATKEIEAALDLRRPSALPGAATVASTLGDAYLIIGVASLYGVTLDVPAALKLLPSLGLAPVAGKATAVLLSETVGRVPFLGPQVRSRVNRSVGSTVGVMAIQRFEARNPGQVARPNHLPPFLEFLEEKVKSADFIVFEQTFLTRGDVR